MYVCMYVVPLYGGNRNDSIECAWAEGETLTHVRLHQVSRIALSCWGHVRLGQVTGTAG